jgi:hypothetical protein
MTMLPAIAVAHRTVHALTRVNAGATKRAKLVSALAPGIIIAALMHPLGAARAETPIPASRFPTYVKFFGDPDNGPQLSTQARTNNVPLTPPFFVTGFYVPLDYLSFGALFSYGNQSGNGNGVIIFAFHGRALAAYWKGSGEAILATAPVIFGGASCRLDQWAHATLIVPKDGQNFRIILDGVEGVTNATAPIAWPQRDQNPKDTLDMTIGSWGNRAPGGGADADNLNAGMRDWLVGLGTPTIAELKAYRDGGDPARIWGPSRIIGYWRFTNEPAAGEPDASGHGHALTYSDAGSAAGHALPILVTPARSGPGRDR